MAQSNDNRTNLLIPLDFYTTLCKMTPESVGEMVMAALNYVVNGTLPDNSFYDVDLRRDTLWDRLVPKLDEDGIKWNDKKLQTQYAGWKSGLERSGQSFLFLSYDEWKNEHKLYDSYCGAQPPEKRPIFNDWLQRKKDLKIQSQEDQDKVELPF